MTMVDEADRAGSRSPDQLMQDLADALSRVLGGDSPAIGRLSYAGTSVTFSVKGARERVTLLLDRTPPALSGQGEPAEVEIELSPGQAERFLGGHLLIPYEIERGAMEPRGPLRKYLEVDPILRELVAAEADYPVRGKSEKGGSRQQLSDDLLAIQTIDLHKRFGSNRVLKGANLRVPEGVISCVIGPSGTGKSVLLNHVIGLMRPDKGDVIVRGRPLSRMSRSEVLRLRLEIGVMFQDGALFSGLNVYDNCAFPLRQHTDLKEHEVREIVMRHLTSVGLQDATGRRPAELSGGMKKRAGLARAMVLDPGIILCDEPDSGLDPVRTALLGDLLIEQHGQIGGTMLVITHNIALARTVAEHISVVWRGEIIESGAAEAVFQSEDPFIQQFLAGDTRGPLSMDA